MPNDAKEVLTKEPEQIIFISHRHEDRAIADKIREALIDWGVGYKIIQTSNFENAITAASDLHDDLRTQLYNTMLQIIIFTESGADWSYVTWEYGVTETPSTVPTNYAIFECGQSEILPVFQDRLRYKVVFDGMDDIKRFTHSLHHDKDFFPGTNKAFNTSVKQDAIERKAKALHTELLTVIPTESSSLVFRWPVFSIVLLPETVKDIRELKAEDKKMAYKIIEENALIEIKVDRILAHFGFGNEPEMTWSRFLTNWITNMEREGKKDKADFTWIDDIHHEIYRSIHDQTALKIKSRFKSIVRQQEFRIIMPRVRKYPNCRMIFDALLYPLDEITED